MNLESNVCYLLFAKPNCFSYEKVCFDGLDFTEVSTRLDKSSWELLFPVEKEGKKGKIQENFLRQQYKHSLKVKPIITKETYDVNDKTWENKNQDIYTAYLHVAITKLGMGGVNSPIIHIYIYIYIYIYIHTHTHPLLLYTFRG